MGIQPEVIGSLREKVLGLLQTTQRYRIENEELKARVVKLQDELHAKSGEIEVLTENLQRMKLARAVSGDEEDVKAAKLRVTKIVREIDKCIALLNR